MEGLVWSMQVVQFNRYIGRSIQTNRGEGPGTRAGHRVSAASAVQRVLFPQEDLETHSLPWGQKASWGCRGDT